MTTHAEKLIEMTLAVVKSKQPVWKNGFTDWRYCKSQGLFYRDSFNIVSNYYCLGNRMITFDYALDDGDFRVVGSTSENWHGAGFGKDLKAALEWVQGAEHKECGWLLWSGIKI